MGLFVDVVAGKVAPPPSSMSDTVVIVTGVDIIVGRRLCEPETEHTKDQASKRTNKYIMRLDDLIQEKEA
jgi:hypothetical protein